MVEVNELRSAILGVLGLPQIGQILQVNGETRARAFEAYVFALAVLAVRRAGGVAEIRGAVTGRNPNPIVFRGAPGQMQSRQQDYCFASCELNRRRFEIHVGVIYKGRSRATHEIDVSICREGAANRIGRFEVQFPGPSDVLGAFECKCYDSDLGTSLGRTFVGLLADFRGVKTRGFVTNGRSPNLAAYFSIQRARPYFGVSPLDGERVEVFCRSLEQELRQWAKVT